MNAPYRTLCARCRRPESTCWCARLTPIESRTRACFLQHPRESKVAIGTARMAHLSLPNSELHQGVDFTSHARVRELAAQPGTALLFPGPGAIEPSTLAQDPPRTLIVVDGTWALARKIIHVNPFLHGLPRIGLVPPAPSNYRIRKEPEEHCVSTIEAVVHVLGALGGDPSRFLPFLATFDWMVDVQVAWAAKHPNESRSRKNKPAVPKVDPTLEELRARPLDVVALYGEANAYALDSGIPGEAELIQLAAVRPSTGERFEALIAPRRPLAPNAPLHLELAASLLEGGEPIATALARFAAFLRPDDLYVGWGRYALDLLRAEQGPERRFTDLRSLTARQLKRRPGGVEQALRLLTTPELPPSLGQGRAGRRLGALVGLLARLTAA